MQDWTELELSSRTITWVLWRLSSKLLSAECPEDLNIEKAQENLAKGESCIFAAAQQKILPQQIIQLVNLYAETIRFHGNQQFSDFQNRESLRKY